MREDEKEVLKRETYSKLKTLYNSGKVKPSLNEIRIELEKDPENLALSLLACECHIRTNNTVDLSTMADVCIELAPDNAAGYYFKGVAFHQKKGKEQEALKNFNQALSIEPDNTRYLKGKAITHFTLFTDYHLPLNFAEKQREKARESLLRIIALVEPMENPSYFECLTFAEASTLLSQNLAAKKYLIKAVNAFNAADAEEQDKNIYKEIIKAQKANIKLMDKIIKD